MVYDNPKKAIAHLVSIKEDKIIRLRTAGIENEGIYSYKDRIFKVSCSKKEFIAANRIKDKNFINVVRIYNTYTCESYIKYNSPIFNYKSNKPYKSFIIEQEKLHRDKNSYVYDSLSLSKIFVDINKRLPFFVSVMNGIAELASVGIIHNDLHSMNIMFDKYNTVKIIDFGYSKIKKKYQQVNVRAKALLI